MLRVVGTCCVRFAWTFTQLGRERKQERHKTIDLITKYNDFTLECNQLAAFPLLFSFVNRTVVVFREREKQSMNHFNLRAASKLKFFNFFMFTQFQGKLNRNERVIQTRKGKT